MTLEEYGKQPPTPEGEMLVQAVAILSTQEPFENMSPDEVWDYVAKQAAEIKVKGKGQGLKVKVTSRNVDTEREETHEYKGDRVQWVFEDGRVDIFNRSGEGVFGATRIDLATFAREYVIRVEYAS